jgi:hypothetical protein
MAGHLHHSSRSHLPQRSSQGHFSSSSFLRSGSLAGSRIDLNIQLIRYGFDRLSVDLPMHVTLVLVCILALSVILAHRTHTLWKSIDPLVN